MGRLGPREVAAGIVGTVCRWCTRTPSVLAASLLDLAFDQGGAGAHELPLRVDTGVQAASVPTGLCRPRPAKPCASNMSTCVRGHGPTWPPVGPIRSANLHRPFGRHCTKPALRSLVDGQACVPSLVHRGLAEGAGGLARLPFPRTAGFARAIAQPFLEVE